MCFKSCLPRVNLANLRWLTSRNISLLNLLSMSLSQDVGKLQASTANGSRLNGGSRELPDFKSHFCFERGPLSS